TAALHGHLLAALTPGERAYHDRLVAPLTPILVGMTEAGVRADPAFIREESAKLRRVMSAISDAHRRRYGVGLGMDQGELTAWLFGGPGLGLTPRSFKGPTEYQLRRGRRRGSPSLDSGHLRALRSEHRGDRHAAGSLDLVLRYRRAAALLVGL